MDAIDFLFDLEVLGIKFGLENIRTLCRELGDPQRRYRRVIVAGTNGKGSVTVMTEIALRAAGHRTARYTSPHLARLEERFVIDGLEVERAALAAAAATVREATMRLLERGDLPGLPTFFEATTALAFELFRRAAIEVAVVEVGLGGRLDATNVEPSLAAAITTIDRDHEQLLGSSIEAIAREKAGVVHPGMICVLGDGQPEVVAVVADACRRQRARLVEIGEARVDAVVDGGAAQVEIATARRHYGPVRLGLKGRHQVPNAVTAALLLEELDTLGLSVPAAAVETGLRTARWPGRLEWLRLGPSRVLLDGAHNAGGARALAAYLAEALPSGLPLVFGAMRDKDTRSMLAALAPVASVLALTAAERPRACPPDQLADEAAMVAARVPHRTFDDPADALAWVLVDSPVACVCGSILLVGGVRTWLLARGAEVEDPPADV
jgi:dihydrofolate synthase/folylpolyglutamate synthase